MELVFGFKNASVFDALFSDLVLQQRFFSLILDFAGSTVGCWKDQLVLTFLLSLRLWHLFQDF